MLEHSTHQEHRTYRLGTWKLAILLWMFACITGRAEDLLQSLTTRGLTLTETEQILIAAPTLSAAQTQAERMAALETIAGKLGLERFLRKSVFAPVQIDIDYIMNQQGERIGHNIHSAFVAYAKLESLRDEQLLQQIFNSPKSASDGQSGQKQDGDKDSVATSEVPPEILEELGIESNEDQQFLRVSLPLLNQVVVRGVIRVEKYDSPNAVTLAWEFDPRFSAMQFSTQQLQDASYANTWTRIERNELGQSYETEPVAYQGCGGWLSVVQVDSEEKQLFVESRMILREPNDWFNGSHTLRSKLPPILQESARKFRRQLETQ